MTLLSFEPAPPPESPIPNVNSFFVRSGLRLISLPVIVLLSAPLTIVPPSRMPQPPPAGPQVPPPVQTPSEVHGVPSFVPPPLQTSSLNVGFLMTLFLRVWFLLSASPSAVIRLIGGSVSRMVKPSIVMPEAERVTSCTGPPGQLVGRQWPPGVRTPLVMVVTPDPPVDFSVSDLSISMPAAPEVTP